MKFLFPAQALAVQGFLIVLGVIAAIIALMCVPVRVRGMGVLEPAGGRIELRIGYLVFCRRLTLRLYLLEAPCFTMLLGDSRGKSWRTVPLATKKKGEAGRHLSHVLRGLFHALRVEKLNAHWRVGAGGDAASDALLTGLLTTLTKTAAAVLFERIGRALRVTGEPAFGSCVLRLNLEGIATVFPAQIILEIIKAKGD